MTQPAHISAWIQPSSRDIVREYARMTGQTMKDVYSDMLENAITRLATDFDAYQALDNTAGVDRTDYTIAYCVGRYPRMPFVETNTLDNALCAVFWAMLGGARQLTEISIATQPIDRHTRNQALTQLQQCGYIALDAPLTGRRKRGRPAREYVVLPQWQEVQAVHRAKLGKETRK